MPEQAPKPPSFMTIAAIFLIVFMLVSWYNTPTPTPPAETPLATASDAAGEKSGFAFADGVEADPDHATFAQAREIVVEMRSRPVPGTDAARQQGFSARCRTKGAALRRYRLEGFAVSAENPSPVVLLDDIAPGSPGSLMLESFAASPKVVVGKQPEFDLTQVIYRLTRVPDGAGRVLPDGSVADDWPDLEPDAVGGDILEMRARARGFEIIRQFVFDAEGDPRGLYGFTATVEIRNLAADEAFLSYRLWGPAGLVPDDGGYYGRVQALAAQAGTPGGNDIGSVQRWDLDKIADKPPYRHAGDGAAIAWTGAKNRFFATLLAADEPRAQTGGVWVAALPADLTAWSPAPEIHAILTDSKIRAYDRPAVAGAYFTPRQFETPLAPGASWRHSYRFYGGPAEGAALGAADPRFDAVLQYTFSWFDPISRGLVWLLNLLHGIVGNYGVAIILLTILIKTLLHPLSRKMYLSGQAMQKVQPLLKEIQRKYANDRQKMGQEQMRLYKEHNINPAGGCLPAFVQLPIFLALFGAFSQHFAVRQAGFIPGWINDLSRPDSVWHLPFTVPLLGWKELSLLPIIYLVMQIFQMRLQPRSPDPQVAQQQKIMQFMPVFFMFLFYTMPSGLVLYFTVSSLYSVVESTMLRRRHPPITPEEAAALAFAPPPATDSHGKALAGAGIGINRPRKGKGK